MFSDNTSDFLFSQCVVDSCGWQRDDGNPAFNDIYCHGVYNNFQARDWCVWGNWFTNNASYGMHLRGGGTMAYNAFAQNAHALDMCSTSHCAYKNVLWQNGMFQMQSLQTFDDVANHAFFEGNFILSPTNLNETHHVGWNDPSSLYGIDLGHILIEGGVGYFIVRNNTLVDTGGIWINQRPPVPGIGDIERNLIANRPTTGYIGGQPMRSMNFTPQTGWGTNGPVTVPENSAWQALDRNAYLIPGGTSAFTWNGLNTGSFATWQASGVDSNGVAPASINFTNGSFGLDAWASSNGAGTTFAALRAAIRTRPWHTWPTIADTTRCYAAFQSAYMPDNVNVPPIDSSTFGYIGASDNRAGILFYSITPSATLCNVGSTVTFTVTPITGASSETLTVVCAGATPSRSSLTWSNSTAAQTFTVTPLAAGTVSVSIQRSGTTILGPTVVTVTTVPIVQPARFAVRQGGGRYLFRKHHA